MYFCIYLIKCIFYCLNTQNNKYKRSRNYIWNQTLGEVTTCRIRLSKVWKSYTVLITPIQCFTLKIKSVLGRSPTQLLILQSCH